MIIEYQTSHGTDAIRLALDDPCAKLLRYNASRNGMAVATSDGVTLIYVRRPDGGTVQGRIADL